MSGSPTHDRDFQEAADAVLTVLERFEFVRLLIVGDLRLHQGFTRLRKQIREVPFQPWHRLPSILAEVDVSLAPLEGDNPFTESKSCIKYLEAGLLAVPTIASPRSDFTRAIEHGRNGLLADTRDEWHTALSELVSSPDRRRAMGAAAYEDVRGNHTTEARARSLHRTFVDLLRSGSSATRLRINVVSTNQAAPTERSLADSLACYLSSRGHKVEAFSPWSDRDGENGESLPADASIATDAAAAAFVAVDQRSLFNLNVVVDEVSAVPEVLQLPLRHIVVGGIAEDIQTGVTVEPDRIDVSGAEALNRIEAAVLETCFVRLTPSLESDAESELTPTRRT
jgi:hypothetical protein